MDTNRIENDFLQLVNKNQNILHKICHIYGRTEDEKKDLYQEITLQLWVSYPSFKQKSAFSTWMYRVALNTAITFSKRRPFFTDSEKKLHNLTIKEEENSELNEDIRILYAAISKLNKIDKAIMLLWLEENSYEKIAETLGLTIKNVSVKIVRAKAKLYEIIKKLS
jgi:RNA polymerase sigma-70 factor (ECF subfamily)